MQDEKDGKAKCTRVRIFRDEKLVNIVPFPFRDHFNLRTAPQGQYRLEWLNADGEMIASAMIPVYRMETLTKCRNVTINPLNN